MFIDNLYLLKNETKPFNSDQIHVECQQTLIKSHSSQKVEEKPLPLKMLAQENTIIKTKTNFPNIKRKRKNSSATNKIDHKKKCYDIFRQWKMSIHLNMKIKDYKDFLPSIK